MANMNAEELYARGRQNYLAEKYDESIADWTEAIKLDPKNDKYYYCRANAYRAKGEYDEAIADYSEAIKLKPKSEIYYSIRAWVYYIKGRLDETLNDYNRLIKLDNMNHFAYYRRGSIYSVMGKKELAMNDFNRAIELNDKDAPFYADRGWEYEQMGRSMEATRDFDKAKSLSKNVKQCYVENSMMFEKAGSIALAIRNLKIALKLDPTDRQLHNKLAALKKGSIAVSSNSCADVIIKTSTAASSRPVETKANISALQTPASAPNAVLSPEDVTRRRQVADRHEVLESKVLQLEDALQQLKTEVATLRAQLTQPKRNSTFDIDEGVSGAGQMQAQVSDIDRSRKRRKW